MKLTLLRRSSQLFFFLLFVYILWSTTYPLNGILPPKTFFVFNPLLMIFMSVSERIVVPGLWTGLLMVVLTVLLGRFFCGWICPLGSMIDLVGRTNKLNRNEKRAVNRPVRLVKFVVFGIGAIAACIGVHVFWVLDPMVIMGRFVSLNFIPFITQGVNGLFVALIQRFEWYGAFYDFYRAFKESWLGVDVLFFSNSFIIFGFVVVVLALSVIKRRLWCRMMCPLGALYALIGRFTFMRRIVGDGCIHCHECNDACSMGAIFDDTEYDAGECIMCMDCVEVCPQYGTEFKWTRPKNEKYAGEDPKGITRRNFLVVSISSLFIVISSMIFGKRAVASQRSVIRPPGALPEGAFLDQCVRCGNCMKVCVTNGLQPTLLETGVQGLWSPQLVPEIGYCEYNCNLCGSACPTQAIAELPLEKKKTVKIGRAEIDKTKCVAWALDMKCLVCEEHCPIPDKAIKAFAHSAHGGIVLKPVVDPDLCIGCGICQSTCPARPDRAIIVNPKYGE